MVRATALLYDRSGAVRGRYGFFIRVAHICRKAADVSHTFAQRRALLVLPHPQPVDASERHAQLREASVARLTEVALVPAAILASYNR